MLSVYLFDNPFYSCKKMIKDSKKRHCKCPHLPQVNSNLQKGMNQPCLLWRHRWGSGLLWNQGIGRALRARSDCQTLGRETEVWGMTQGNTQQDSSSTWQQRRGCVIQTSWQYLMPFSLDNNTSSQIKANLCLGLLHLPGLCRISFPDTLPYPWTPAPETSSPHGFLLSELNMIWQHSTREIISSLMESLDSTKQALKEYRILLQRLYKIPVHSYLRNCHVYLSRPQLRVPSEGCSSGSIGPRLSSSIKFYVIL